MMQLNFIIWKYLWLTLLNWNIFTGNNIVWKFGPYSFDFFWFPEIYLLKNIATARSKCTTKYENMMSYNWDYIVPDQIDLTDFCSDDWQVIKNRLNEEVFMFVKDAILTKNKFAVFFMSFLNILWKNNFLAILFRLKTKSQTNIFRNF